MLTVVTLAPGSEQAAAVSAQAKNALRYLAAMFPQIFGKYVLERELAAGGMARVFLATLRGAVGFEKRLVVKQIRAELAVDDAFVRRFVEEAKTAVELSHPNIVPVYELGVEQGVYYIAMEYCSGVTLSEVLAHTGPLDPEEGAYVGAEVCRALEYAHRRASIVHRDVTPRNVLLDDEGGVRLIDFGIAAPTQASSGRHEVFGSPGHMPPEQLRGDALGPETDVFAVGALLIEAWTGKPPFRRATAQESAHALRERPPPIDRVVPALAPLAELVNASVALEIGERPADAERLGRGLRDFLRTSDAVDVGRRLAARVRRARPQEDDALATAVTPPPDSTPPLVTPTAATPTTATFAAREEMVEWTRKLSSIPPPPEAPESTRRLSTAPSTARTTSRGRTLWVGGALALVLLALGAGLVGANKGPRAAPALSPPSGVEPPRTGPVPAVAPASPTLASAAPSAAAAETTAVLAVVSPPPRTPEAAPSHSARPAAAPGVPAPGAGQDSRPASTTTSAAPAPVAASERAAESTLRLTADPQAVVSVSGNGFSQTSATPVRALVLAPGSYRIVFRSETYGAPVTTEVTLAPGARRSIHADFRSAEPSVIVR
jgi:serine/threonine-protein kinase